MFNNQDLGIQLWNQCKQKFAVSKMQMLQSGQLTINGRTMYFVYRLKGNRPTNGYTLIFGFHGGGGTTAEANNQQYNNHKNLYNNYLPDGSIWFTPRSCQDQWDMWFKDYMEDFVLQIIRAFALNNIIDVNKVFLTGYSAGGDGVYHMAPRMADFLAGAAMMAGHPNGINMMNIRNIGFSLQVGGNDTAYNRNKEGIKNIRMLNQMGQNYGGFKHQSKIHDGKPHWMALQDAKVFGWLFSFTRNPYPDLILFKPCPRRNKPTFYYLRINQPKNGQKDQQVIVKKSGNQFKIISNRSISILVNRKMVNPNEPIKIVHNYKTTVNRRMMIKPQIIQKTFFQRLDPYYVFEDQLISQPTQMIDMKSAFCAQFQLQPIEKQAQYEKPLPMNPSQPIYNFNDSVKPLIKRRKTSAPTGFQQQQLEQFRKQQNTDNTDKWQKWQATDAPQKKNNYQWPGQGQQIGGGQQSNPWKNQNINQQNTNTNTQQTNAWTNQNKNKPSINNQNAYVSNQKASSNNQFNQSNQNIQQQKQIVLKRHDHQCCSLQ